jgi:ech hydrogenase subunit D
LGAIALGVVEALASALFTPIAYFNYSPGVEMVALRMVVGKDEEVPSISGIYLCAVLAENEMFEQYGLKVKDIAIDFGGLMLLGNGSPVTPMLKDKAAGGKGGE